MARVTAPARLHFGFRNLSLDHERLYGGVGAALARPRVVVEATPDDAIDCPDPTVRTYAERAVESLGVPGVAVTVEETVPRHVGLGSGTQVALATFAAVATAYGSDPAVREHAPGLGRGGRSGVGVGTFEAGGFVVDAGQPTERFTPDPPPVGEWTVPPVLVRHEIPMDWRFVIVVPDTEPGQSGDEEDASMRSIIERADPAIADDLAHLLVGRLLPALVEGEWRQFGRAVARFGRRNGAWYADVQGGAYRPVTGRIVKDLDDSPAIAGAGQSSWGPTAYGITHADHETAARDVARSALDAAGVSGDVSVVRPGNSGVRIEESTNGPGA